jgi:putative transposase
MDLVGPKYLKGGFRFYFQNFIDTENHFAGVYPIRDKASVSVAKTVVRFWTTYGIPDYLQMDNEMSFRGSNRYPRSLGIVLRLALSQGVTPIFIPPAEPWRNGIIEKFNSTMDKYFFSKQKVFSFEELDQKSVEFSDFHNNNHRYTSQGGKTPCMITSISQDHKMNQVNLEEPIPLVNGSVIFIRFIRSDRRLQILGTTFTLNQQLIYTYVIAEIVIEQHVLLIKQDGIIYHVFPYAMPVDW